MNHLPTGLATLTLLAGAILLAVVPAAGSTTTSQPVLFGMDAAGVSAQTAAGVAPDYGTFWIGPWTLSSGWGGPDGQLTAMKNAGVTPAVHFYYWGDDITPTCVENGCWSSLHNAQKTRAGWNTLGTQLTDHLNSKMGGAPVVVFLESEFNKGGISSYEPFDGYMAEMANKIHQGYPNAIVVLGYGNWDNAKWGNFDRAAAASDMVGLQAMRGSTKDSAASYDAMYDATLVGVRKLETLFPTKPIMLTDVALSSYPDATYSSEQAQNLGKFFTGMPALKDAGVTAMIYRSWKDSPTMDLANYYGEAERHWGLAKADGTHKAAAKVWIDGVKAERAATIVVPNRAPTASFTAAGSQLAVTVDASASADPDGNALTYAWTFGDGSTATGRTATRTYAAAGTYTIGLTVSDGLLSSSASKAVTVSKPTSTTTTSTSPGFTATVTPSGNEWWVQAGVSSAKTISKVEAKAGTGSWIVLDKQSYGWTKSIHVPKGTQMQFRVTASDGQTATTPAQAWLVDMSAKTATSGTSSTTTTSSPPVSSTTTTTAATTFKATFTPKSQTNNWWVESAVTANQPITKVEAKVNSGAYVTLPKTDWGTYAKSMSAPDGAKVTFRATNASGATSTSVAYTWG